MGNDSLGRALRAALIGALCLGSGMAGCRCKSPPRAHDAAAGDAHGMAPVDGGQGPVAEPMTPAEARLRWVRLVGADQGRFHTLLELERDLRKRCADPKHRLSPDEVAPLARFVADLAAVARAPKDQAVVAAIAAEVKRLAGQPCDEALRGTRSLFGGAR